MRKLAGDHEESHAAADVNYLMQKVTRTNKRTPARESTDNYLPKSPERKVSRNTPTENPGAYHLLHTLM